jgi:hypothetical protein
MTDSKAKPEKKYKGLKYQEPKARQRLSKELIAFQEEGGLIRDYPKLSRITIEKLFKTYPEDFDLERIEQLKKSNRDFTNNKYSEKFKTSKERQDVFKRFCDHVSDGYSIRSFPEASDETMHRYMKVYPDDCPIEEYHASRRRAQMLYEVEGRKILTAENTSSASATIYKFEMVNKFNYTLKEEVTHKIDEDSKDAFQKVHVYLPDNTRDTNKEKDKDS